MGKRQKTKLDTAVNYVGASNQPPAAPYSSRNEALRKLFRNKAAVISLFVLVIICLACAMAPILTKWDYTAINSAGVFEPPSFAHIFGADNLGRDLFSRLLYGGRLTLRIAFAATVLAAAVGGTIGLLIGYFNGKADYFISYALDILASIPVILLIIVAEIVLGWGRGNFMYAIAIASIPQFARLMRASVMRIMGCQYIEAARALGVRRRSIIIRHVLHNAAPPLIVRFTSGVAESLLICTVMGYLSIGINPPTPEWGALVYNSKSFIRSHPRLMIIPCVMISACVISICVFGDGLRDVLDPKENGA